jgi:hypothetical protein
VKNKGRMVAKERKAYQHSQKKSTSLQVKNVWQLILFKNLFLKKFKKS